MTGCTGVVGAPLRKIFENNGLVVYYLIRDGRERHHNNDVKLSGIKPWQIIDGEITNTSCGVSPRDVSFLRGRKIKKVVHIAGSIKFDDTLRDEIMRTNVIGTKNMLELAELIGAKEFHFVSTAYADTQRNAYEQSKYYAEMLVKNSGINFSIYRIGIVVGDSNNGEITDYTGYYGFLEILHRLAVLQRKKCGLTVGTLVNIPIHINYSFTSTLNLVPRDWLVNMMYKLMKMESKKGVFYVTHPNPMLVRKILKCALEILNISGISCSETVIQRAADKMLSQYLPYVTKEEVFPLDSTKKALGVDYMNPPEVTPEMHKILLDFAVGNNFGKKTRVS